MLVITTPMLHKIKSRQQEKYIEKLLTFIQGQAPSLFEHLTDTEAKVRIRAAVESARTIGNISASGLAKYAALCMLCGLEFIHSREVLHFLNTPGRSLDVKIEWLITRVATQLSDFGSTHKI